MRSNFSQSAILNDVATIVMDVFDKANDDAVVYAQKVTPVRTRKLQRGWYKRKAQRVGATRVRSGFQNDVEYARFVDKGTVKMAARNMSGQAIDAIYSTVPARLKARLK